MNIRKPVDYSALFTELEVLLTKGLPQLELYCQIGRLISGRPEKGVAIAAAEYLQGTYPDASGFSPRNLRRMRAFYCAYKNEPDAMAAAMQIGWTQNVVILEAGLTAQENLWYLQAVRRFGWSKGKLLRQIASAAHLHLSLDLPDEVCYNEKNTAVEEDSSHAKAEDYQRNGTGNAGAADGIPPVFFLFHPKLLYRRIHAQPVLVCGRRGRPVGVADGTGPPGRGGLWQAVL